MLLGPWIKHSVCGMIESTVSAAASGAANHGKKVRWPKVTSVNNYADYMKKYGISSYHTEIRSFDTGDIAQMLWLTPFFGTCCAFTSKKKHPWLKVPRLEREINQVCCSQMFPVWDKSKLFCHKIPSQLVTQSKECDVTSIFFSAGFNRKKYGKQPPRLTSNQQSSTHRKPILKKDAYCLFGKHHVCCFGNPKIDWLRLLFLKCCSMWWVYYISHTSHHVFVQSQQVKQYTEAS